MRVQTVVLSLAIGFAAAAQPAPQPEPHEGETPARDWYFGEALYYAQQGHYFDALERLDAELGQHRAVDEPALDSMYRSLHEAEFSVGDFELNYRMHHRAGRAITAVLEGAVDEAVRNDAAYRLARIHFQKGQLEDALHALDRIVGEVPDDIAGGVEFLRANTYIGLGRHAEAAEVLRRLQSSESLTGFAAYNFGIALLEDSRRQDAIEQLDRAGQIQSTDEAVLAIRDKSNFVLGTLLVEDQQFDRAKQSFDRVRLEGPYSNAALLASGWAATAAFSAAPCLPFPLLASLPLPPASLGGAALAPPPSLPPFGAAFSLAVLPSFFLSAMASSPQSPRRFYRRASSCHPHRR